MPESKWDEYKLIEALGVLPEIDQNWEEWLRFTITQNDLVLRADFCPYKDFVWISLAKIDASEPLISFFLHVRGNAIYVNEKNISCLRLEDCVVTTDEYDYSDQNNTVSRMNFEIYVFPQIKLNFV